MVPIKSYMHDTGLIGIDTIIYDGTKTDGEMESVIYNVLYYINGTKEVIKDNEKTKSNSESRNGNTCRCIIDACYLN